MACPTNLVARLTVAAVTAVLVSVLVYLGVWTTLRQAVVMGGFGCGSRITVMKNDFFQIRQALSKFSREHSRYPDSLNELPELKDWKPLDPWRRPYQYQKTGDGFRLFSLGRDGRVGGIGMDADIDSDPAISIDISPTISQFLFEGASSGLLLSIALVASLCAGLALYLMSSHNFAQGRLLVLSVVAILSTVLVAGLLMMICLIGDR